MEPTNNVSMIQTILRTTMNQCSQIKDFPTFTEEQLNIVAELLHKKNIVVDTGRKLKYNVFARVDGIITYLDAFPDTERARQFERRYHELYKAMHDGKDIDTFVETCYLT